MSRYIEIVFDDSGSMTSFEAGKPKHTLAKELFNDVVLPQLGKRDDELVLRTLRKGCNGSSTVKSFSTKTKLKESINNIDDFYNNTPLYLTIRDSIRACSASDKTEKFIFVLTDGDDNCSESLDEILSKKELEEKDRIKTKIILVQFAVTSQISQNNLTVLSQKLNAQNVIIGQEDLKNTNKMKGRLNAAFIESGMDKSSKLDHCFIEFNDEKLIDSWYLIELFQGIDFYLAQLLYQEKLLSWKPNFNKPVSNVQFAELEFLYILRFRNNLPEALVKQMLSQLKKPYRYTHDCIYWDFTLRKWRYYKKESELNIINNPQAKSDDEVLREYPVEELYEPNELQAFDTDRLYTVRLNDKKAPTFSLVKHNYDGMNVKFLKDGDIISVRFK